MQETCKSFQVKASANREVDHRNTFLWVKREHEKAIKTDKKTFTAGLNADSTWSHVTVRQCGGWAQAFNCRGDYWVRNSCSNTVLMPTHSHSWRLTETTRDWGWWNTWWKKLQYYKTGAVTRNIVTFRLFMHLTWFQHILKHIICS